MAMFKKKTKKKVASPKQPYSVQKRKGPDSYDPKVGGVRRFNPKAEKISDYGARMPETVSKGSKRPTAKYGTPPKKGKKMRKLPDDPYAFNTVNWDEKTKKKPAKTKAGKKR